MEFIEIILIITLTTTLVTLFFGYKKIQTLLSKNQEKEDTAGMLVLQNQINEIQKTLDNKLHETNQDMQKSITDITQRVLDSTRDSNQDMQKSIKQQQESMHAQMKSSQQLIHSITTEITEVKKGNEQVITIADQLKNLEQVLKNQKQRGNLGEAGLELVLSNLLPPDAYETQYKFKNGEIVDAIIKAKEGIIPVDAKFPLENYTKLIEEKDESKKQEIEKKFKTDLKGRIDETSKYILPEEGTLPFAFMFLPAEGIYYDLFINKVGAGTNSRNLIEYAYKDKNVIIVSPTTFAAYLQSVIYGFRAFQVEEKAQEIMKNVEELRRHINKYNEYMQKLGRALGTTVNHYNSSYKEFKKIDKDIYKITEKTDTGKIEPMTIDKPTD